MKDLSKNENQYPPSPLVAKALKEKIEAKFYLREPKLQLNIAEFVGVDSSYIYIANGAEEVLINIFQGVSKRSVSERKILLANYSWPFYDFYIKDAEAEIVRFELGNNFEYIVEPIRKCYLEKSPSLIVLCSPNNPTSSIIREQSLKEILEFVDKDCIIVIDETYKGFVEKEHNYIHLFNKFKNLIIVRSFSKFYGLAGVRIGYGLIHPGTKLKLKLPSNRLGLSVFMEKLGIAALESTGYYKEVAAKIVTDRDKIIKSINETKLFNACNSNTNFVFMWSPQDEISTLVKKFENCEIKVFVFTEEPYKGYLRFGVGLEEDTEKILNIFTSYKGSEKCEKLNTIYT